MCHYDIAYRGPDARSANIAPKCNFTICPASLFFRIRNHDKTFYALLFRYEPPLWTYGTWFQPFSTYLVNRNTIWSRKTFFPIVFWWGQELSRNSQTETTKILFYAMFCLLQTLDERIFWYSLICSRYCRTLKQKRKWAAKTAICIYERGLMVSISLSMLSCWTAEQWLGKFFPLNFVDG